MSVKHNLVDQKEYLKKYLSGDKKKKKKDKKNKKHESRLKIIDDNLFAHVANDIDEELLLMGEDAPQIVGDVIEVDPDEIKVLKWRNIAVKEEPEDDSVEAKYKPEADDLWGIKKEDKQIKDEFSAKRHKIKKEPVDSESDLNGTKLIDSDLSPPRRRRRQNSDSDLSPPRRRRRNNSDSDMSLQKRRSSPSNDKSGSRRRRGKSNDSNLSLSRRRKRGGSNNSDMSLPRRRKSPIKNNTSPRRIRRKSDDSDLSLPRRRKRVGSHDSDLSLRRKRNDHSARDSRNRRKSDDSDSSLSRRKHSSHSRRKSRERARTEKRYGTRPIQNPEFIDSDNDSSLDIRRVRNTSVGKVNIKREILSPEICHSSSDTTKTHKKNNNSSIRSSRTPPVCIRKENLKPLRKKESRWNKLDDKTRKSLSPIATHRGKDRKIHRTSPIRNRNERKSSSPPPTHKGKIHKTLDGKKAGLQDAKALKVENEKRRREEEQIFEQMSGDVSGRDAEIAVRKSGRKGRRGREAEEEDPQERLRREQREKEKKEVFDRWGKGVKQVEDYRQRLEEDAHEASKPLARYSNDEDLDRYLRDQEHIDDPMLEYMREKKRSKAKQDNVPVIPKYEGTFPENRYGILPGYRWDGVDRSNGYEKRWFEVRNERKAREEEAYKYSVEDM